MPSLVLNKQKEPSGCARIRPRASAGAGSPSSEAWVLLGPPGSFWVPRQPVSPAGRSPPSGSLLSVLPIRHGVSCSHAPLPQFWNHAPSSLQTLKGFKTALLA